MELELLRTYLPNGTNGAISRNGKPICYSIELPWRNNVPEVSCIPEGRYTLEKTHTEKFGWHLHLLGVKGRGLVMIHPANDALKELKGCIAPVSILCAEGKGLRSRIALEDLLAIVFPVLEDDQQVFLTIKSIQHESA